MLKPIRIAIEFDVRGEPQLRQAATSLGNLEAGLVRQGHAPAAAFQALDTHLGRFAASWHRFTREGVQSFNLAFERSFHLFQRFSQITLLAGAGQLTALAFTMRSLASDFFRVNEEFGGLEITMRSVFGSVGAARRIREELANITITSPLPFMELANAVRAASVMPAMTGPLAAQASGMGKTAPLNSEAGFLRRYTTLIEKLIAFRPDKDTPSAVFAVREALGGEVRSLIRRFEFPSSLLVTHSGKPLDVLRRDPTAMFGAIESALDNLISTKAVRAIALQPTKMWENLKEQLLQIPLLRIGRAREETPEGSLVDRIMRYSQGMLMSFGSFAGSDTFKEQAGRIGQVFGRVFDQVAQMGENAADKLFSFFQVDSLRFPGAGRLERFYLVLEHGLEGLEKRLPAWANTFEKVFRAFLPLGRDFLRLWEIIFTVVERATKLFGPLGGLAAFSVFKNLPDVISRFTTRMGEAYVQATTISQGATALTLGPFLGTAAGRVTGAGSTGRIGGSNPFLWEAEQAVNPLVRNQALLHEIDMYPGGRVTGGQAAWRYSATGTHTGYYGQQVDRVSGRSVYPWELPSNMAFAGGQHPMEVLEQRLQRAGIRFDAAANRMVWATDRAVGTRRFAAGTPVSRPELERLLGPTFNTYDNLLRSNQATLIGRGVTTRTRMTPAMERAFLQAAASNQLVPPAASGYTTFADYARSQGYYADRRGRWHTVAGGFATRDEVMHALNTRDVWSARTMGGSERPTLTGSAAGRAYYNQSRVAGMGRVAAFGGAAMTALTSTIGFGTGAAAATAGMASGVLSMASALLGPLALMFIATGAISYIYDWTTRRAAERFQQDAAARLGAVGFGKAATHQLTGRLQSEIAFQQNLQNFLKLGGGDKIGLQRMSQLGTWQNVSVPWTLNPGSPFTVPANLRPLTTDVEEKGFWKSLSRLAFQPTVASPYAWNEAGAAGRNWQRTQTVVPWEITNQSRNLDVEQLQLLRSRAAQEVAALQELTKDQQAWEGLSKKQPFESNFFEQYVKNQAGEVIGTEKFQFESQGQVETALVSVRKFLDETQRFYDEAVSKMRQYTDEVGRPLVPFGPPPTEKEQQELQRLSAELGSLTTAVGFRDESPVFEQARAAMRGFELSPSLAALIEASSAESSELAKLYRPFAQLGGYLDGEIRRLNQLAEVQKQFARLGGQLPEQQTGKEQYSRVVGFEPPGGPTDLQLAWEEHLQKIRDLIGRAGALLATPGTNAEGRKVYMVTADQLDALGKPVKDETTGETKKELLELGAWANREFNRFQAQGAEGTLNTLQLRVQESLLEAVDNLSLSHFLKFSREMAEGKANSPSARLALAEQSTVDVLTRFMQLLQNPALQQLVPGLDTEIFAQYQQFSNQLRELKQPQTAAEAEGQVAATDAASLELALGLRDTYKRFAAALPMELGDTLEQSTKTFQVGVNTFTSKLTASAEALEQGARELEYNLRGQAFENIAGGQLNARTPTGASFVKQQAQLAREYYLREYGQAMPEAYVEAAYEFDSSNMPALVRPFARERKTLEGTQQSITALERQERALLEAAGQIWRQGVDQYGAPLADRDALVAQGRAELDNRLAKVATQLQVLRTQADAAAQNINKQERDYDVGLLNDMVENLSSLVQYQVEDVTPFSGLTQGILTRQIKLNQGLYQGSVPRLEVEADKLTQVQTNVAVQLQQLGLGGVYALEEQLKFFQTTFATYGTQLVDWLTKQTTLAPDQRAPQEEYKVATSLALNVVSQLDRIVIQRRQLFEQLSQYRQQSWASLDVLLSGEYAQQTAVRDRLLDLAMENYRLWSPMQQNLPQALREAAVGPISALGARGAEAKGALAEQGVLAYTREAEALAAAIADMEQQQQQSPLLRLFTASQLQKLREEYQTALQKAHQFSLALTESILEPVQLGVSMLQELTSESFGSGRQTEVPLLMERFRKFQAAQGKAFTVRPGDDFEQAVWSSPRGFSKYTGEIARREVFQREYTAAAAQLEQYANLQASQGADPATIVEPLREAADQMRRLADETARWLEELQGRGGIAATFLEGFGEEVDLWVAKAANWKDAGSQVATTLRDELGRSLVDIMVFSKDAGEAFEQFGFNVLRTAAEIATNKLVEMLLGIGFKLVGGLFSAAPGSVPITGGNVSPSTFATGGLVTAKVASGEYVVPPATVEKFGANHFERYQSLPVNLPAVYSGRIPGTKSYEDNRMARLPVGSFVIPTATVDRLGTAYFDRLNREPAFATGGLVGTPNLLPITRSKETGAGSFVINAPVEIHLGKEETGRATNTSNQAALKESSQALQAAIREELLRQTRQGGALWRATR